MNGDMERLLASLRGEREALGVLTSILDREPLGIAVFEPLEDGSDLRLVFANPPFQALKPFRPMHGRLYSEIWPELTAFAVPRFMEVARTGTPWVEHDLPLEVESEQGVLVTRYYTYEISRLLVGDRVLVLDTAAETTAEVQAREREAAAHRTLEDALGRMTDGMLAVDSEFRCTFITEQGARIVSRTPEQVIGKKLWEEFPEAEAFIERYRRVMETQTPESFVEEYTPLGLWLETRAYPSPSGLTVFFLDVTERVKAQRSVELERERLQALLDVLPVAVFISDTKGGIVYTNDAATELWGPIPPTESADEYGLFKGWRPETGERLKPGDWAGARALRGEIVLGELVDIERFDGDRATILNSSVPIRDPGGTITGMVAVEQDVTERRRQEEELQQGEERFRLLSEANSMLLSSSDPEGSIQAIAEKVMRHLKADVFFNYVLDPGADRLRLNAWDGVDERVAKMIERLDLGQAICGCVARDGERIISVDVQHNGDARADLVRRMGVRCYCCHPLKSGDKTIGTLSFGTKSKDCFDDDEIELMRTVSNQVSIAMERVNAERGSVFQSYLLESVSDSVIVYYPDDPERGKLVYVNEAAYAARGYTRDEMLRLNVLDIIAPEWRPTLRGRLESLARGEEVRAESAHVRKDGTTFPVEVLLRGVEFGERSLVVNVSRDITERKRFERDLQESLERSTLLLQAAGALSASIDLDHVLNSLFDVLINLTGRSRVVVSLYDEATDELVVRAGTGGVHFGRGTRIPVAALAPQVALSIQHRRSMIVDYEAPDMPQENRERAAKVASALSLSVPLVFEDRVIGHIGLDEPGVRREFTQTELSLIEGIASEAAAAIERARLYESERDAREQVDRQLQTTKLLLDTADALAAWTDLHELLSGLAEAVLPATGHSRVTISLWDESTDELQIAASAGKQALSPMRVPRERLSSALRGVVETGERSLTDYDRLPSGQRGVADRYASHLALQVPLRFRDKIVGVIGIDDPGERREFNDREIELIEGIASQAAVAIENARLFEERTEQARYAEALNRINATIHSTLEIEEILGRVVIDVATSLGVEASIVQLRRNGYWETAKSHGMPEAFAHVRVADADAPTSMEAVETRAPVVVHDTSTDPRVNAELMARIGVSAYMLAPLTVRDEVIGVLFADRLGGATGFNSQQVDFLEKTAATVALAIENARLYATEHHIADRLQGALLALPDEVRGVEFAHAYHSATEAARVGGDFYDLFELNQDHVGIVIGDVAGKGIDAAVLTSMVKNSIRAHANERGKTPKQILELTNDVIFKATATESFVTVFFGILDCRDGRLVYGNAGHTTAALVRSDGHVGKLSVTGPLLGAFEDAPFDEAEACFELDEQLFLYTDGLTEARRDGELFGEERAFDLLGATRNGSPRDVVRAVIEDVLGFSGGQLRDDLAILALKRVEPGTVTPHQQKLEM